MGNNPYRVWKPWSDRFFTPRSDQPSFCVNADSHEEAASQIAMELNAGGFYRVHATDNAGDAKVVRIVPVTTYEAVETVAESGFFQKPADTESTTP